LLLVPLCATYVLFPLEVQHSIDNQIIDQKTITIATSISNTLL